MAHDAPGMKGYRPRTEAGPLREKRGDTHMETIERNSPINHKLKIVYGTIRL